MDETDAQDSQLEQETEEQAEQKTGEKTGTEEKAKSRMPSFGLIVTAIVFLAIGIVAGSFISPTGMATATVPAGNSAQLLSSQEIGLKVTDYVTANFLAEQDMTASLSSVEEYSDSMYKVNLELYNGTEKVQDAAVLATKDGKDLILSTTSVFNLDEPLAQAAAPEPTQTASLSCENVPKEENAQMELFVVSYCPFGLQAQRMAAPIADILGDNLTIRYIGSVSNGQVTSMHGEQEAVENHLQICLREEQKDKYWDYVNCFIKAGETETCLAEANIDTEELDACMADSSRGVAYAQVDFGLANSYGVSGSPTLILNGNPTSEFAFAEGMGIDRANARSSDNVKNLLCCGFNTEPDACSTELYTTGAATSFSQTYNASGTASSGSC